MSGYAKGRDGKARTVKNPLEGSIGDLSIDALGVTGNITVGNLLTDNYLLANGSPFVPTSTYGNSNVASYLPVYSGNISAGNVTVTGFVDADVLYEPADPSDWPIVSDVNTLAAGLDQLANVVANFEIGVGFVFSGPFSNDSAANSGGVAIGQVYYNPSGGLVVRQT